MLTNSLHFDIKRFHWSDRHLFGRVGPVMGVVDGTSCEIQRPCDQFAQWVFSDEKHKMFADKYQGERQEFVKDLKNIHFYFKFLLMDYSNYSCCQWDHSQSHWTLAWVSP
jgi:hypothetical protein